VTRRPPLLPPGIAHHARRSGDPTTWDFRWLHGPGGNLLTGFFRLSKLRPRSPEADPRAGSLKRSFRPPLKRT